MKVSLPDYKDFLVTEINSLEIKNFKKQLDQIRTHLKILESLESVEMLTEESFITDLNEEKKEENLPKEEPKLKHNHFLFKKTLFGGNLEGITFRVPETVVREMNLESGDIVTFDGSFDIRNLRLVSKREPEDAIEDDFIIYKYCQVKKDDPLLYCDEALFGGKTMIRIDEIPYKFVLPTNIIEKLKIKEGDFVDIGCEKSNRHSMKVVWKYETDEHVTPKTSSYYKDKSEKVLNEMFYGVDFEGSKVLIIGCEPKKRFYKEAIEECKGEFSFMSGEEQSERITSAIDKAEVVLILKDFLSHATVWNSVDHCKEISKPFTVVDGLGIKTIIFETRKLVSTLEKENV